MADNIAQFPQPKRPKPFEIKYFSQWSGKDPQPLEWLVRDCIPRGSVVLFSGDSGLGKSLMAQQLQIACALGREWLGYDAEACHSFGLYCEDTENVLQWRMRHIARYYGIDEADLELKAAFVSRIGEDCSLMDFNRKTDRGALSPLYDQIVSHIDNSGCELLILDTRSRVFNGVDFIKPQVIGFMNALQALADKMHGAVVLTDHPSLTGLADGRGTAGSVQWRAAARCHIYAKRPRGFDEDAETNDNEVVLRTMKSNWGPNAKAAHVVWKDGVFVRSDRSGGAPATLLERIQMETDILNAARHLLHLGTRLSSNKMSPSFFPTLIHGEALCQRYPFATITAAMDRMLVEHKLMLVTQDGRKWVVLPGGDPAS
jgi:RecA-family ATPase